MDKVISFDDISPRLIQSLIDRIDVLEKMIYNYDAKGIKKGTLKGIKIQQIIEATKTTPEIVLAESYVNTKGGTYSIFDILGNLNLRMGSESGSSANVGGTIVLYNDCPKDATEEIAKLYERIGLGIDLGTGAGIFNAKDSSGNTRTGVYGDDMSVGPTVFICDASGNMKTYLTETTGVINGQTIATQTYANNSAASALSSAKNYTDNAIDAHVAAYHSTP